MNNQNGLTPEQERFFNHTANRKSIDAPMLFMVAVCAIISAWVIIQIIQYLQLQSALKEVELKSRQVELEYQDKMMRASLQVSKTFQDFGLAMQRQDKKPVQGKIIHVDQELAREGDVEHH